MVQINWGLGMGPNSFENALAQGLQVGTQIAQRREQEAQRNALSAYAVDPSDQNFNALAQALPEYAIQVRGQRDAAAQAAREQDVRRRAAMGDPDAMLELAGVDLTAWRGLNSDQQALAVRNAQVIGEAAQYIATLPPEQRAMAWDQQVDLLSRDNPGLARYRGQYSEAGLQAAIAQAGAFNEYWQRQQPNYMAIPHDNSLVNVRDPQAVQQFMSMTGQSQGGGVVNPSVPSGSPLAQPLPAPAVGTIEDGYRFRGGNPADPNSWEPVGQPMSAVNFPPAPQPQAFTQQDIASLVAQYGQDQVNRWIASGAIVGNN